MKKIFLVILTVLTCGIGTSQTVVNSKFGKGIMNVIAQDSSWSMKIGLRFQSLFMGSTLVNDEVGTKYSNAQFLIRRARLKFGGYAYSPKLKYKIELGLSNKDLGKASIYTNSAPRMILDAVVKWNFYKGFTLWAGQTKLPGNRERLISSGNLELVDRSLLNKVFNIDRDMGVQLHHKHKINNVVLKESYSFSIGEGRNYVGKNLGGFKHTYKVEVLPFGDFAAKGSYSSVDLKREKKPKLAIAMALDYHDNAVKTRGNSGSLMETEYGFFETDILTLFADFMFKYNGWSIMGEYAKRNAPTLNEHSRYGSPVGESVEVGTGANLSIGYLFDNDWQVATRYTNIIWDKNVTGKSAKSQYTMGLSKFIVGHKLKVQSDFGFTEVEDSSVREMVYRLQVDLHF